MNVVEIYHNPRCSKSRATLQLLTDRELEPVVIEYTETAPTPGVVAELAKKLSVSPRRLIRFKENLATELGLSASDDRSDDEWCALISENPVLLERPIVVAGNQAAIGRPPENVLKILEL